LKLPQYYIKLSKRQKTVFSVEDIKIRLLKPGRGFWPAERDGFIHRKTTPYIIFAQAYQGRYELRAVGKHFDIGEGGAFFTPPNLPLEITHHINHEAGEMRARWIHFNVTLWGSVPLEALFDFPLAVEKTDAERLAGPVEELLRLAGKSDLASAVREKRLGLECLELLLPLLKPRKNMEETLRRPGRLPAVIEYMRAHCAEKLSVRELSLRSGMSRAGLYQLFGDTIGVPPHQYITQLRIELAAEKLRETGMTLAEIASALGYPNQFLLSRHFKNQHGVSPREYRKTRPWQFD
jgi:AraC-like DNA-binding protein